MLSGDPSPDPRSHRAILAAYVFLGLNGYDIDATEVEVAALIESVASREMSEAEVAEWLRGACVSRT